MHYGIGIFILTCNLPHKNVFYAATKIALNLKRGILNVIFSYSVEWLGTKYLYECHFMEEQQRALKCFICDFMTESICTGCTILLFLLRKCSCWCLVFSLFNVKAWSGLPSHTHTHVQCVVYCPTLNDSSVTTGNYTLHHQEDGISCRGGKHYVFLKLNEV